MPSYSGKFQDRSDDGALNQEGACEVSFDTETCVVTPAYSTPIVFDFGDVDVVAPEEWQLTLQLYPQRRIQLSQFGPAFGNMCQELLAAWRDRTVRCLLLEDLEEVARFNATVNALPAELRIYGSNLAVLPLGGRAEQWRLADVDSLGFDESTYTFNIVSGTRKLAVAKLARKTEEFGDKLRGAWNALRRSAAEALHLTFPFLDAGQLQRLVMLAPEGRSVKLASLAGVHPNLPEALVSRAVGPHLKPYFEALRSHAAADTLMTGFKFVRPDEGGVEPGEDQPDEGGADEDHPPLFFWFFFPLAGRNVAAWEATSGSGRATYFFRAAPPVEESIAQLTRGLALINFRREPIYLPDASLGQQAKFHRYAIGRRKLPALQNLRTAFLGRAIHSSVEEWEQQVAQVSETPTPKP